MAEINRHVTGPFYLHLLKNAFTQHARTTHALLQEARQITYNTQRQSTTCPDSRLI